MACTYATRHASVLATALLVYAATLQGEPTPSLPALPSPPVELRFEQLYKHPVGPRGLEPTAQLLRLDGQRVRMVGYMVDTEQPVTGMFMLAPLPVQLAESDDGPADDLPGGTVFVHLPSPYASRTPAHQLGLLQIVGKLELGAREESNGRISYIRLLAEQPPVAQPRIANKESQT